MPGIEPVWEERDDFMVNGAYWFGCLVGLLLHEAAHAATAVSLGLRVKRFGMNWRGPYTVRETGAPLTNALVIIAGPFINIMLAVLTWQYSVPFALANLALGLTNLFPTRNSDGAKFAREIGLARQAYLRGSTIPSSQVAVRLP